MNLLCPHKSFTLEIWLLNTYYLEGESKYPTWQICELSVVTFPLSHWQYWCPLFGFYNNALTCFFILVIVFSFLHLIALPFLQIGVTHVSVPGLSPYFPVLQFSRCDAFTLTILQIPSDQSENQHCSLWLENLPLDFLDSLNGAVIPFPWSY